MGGVGDGSQRVAVPLLSLLLFSYQIALVWVAPPAAVPLGLYLLSLVSSPSQVACLLQQLSCCTVCPASLSCFSLGSICASLLSQYQLFCLLCLAFVLLWHLPSVSSCVCLLVFTSHSQIFFCIGTRDSCGSILVQGGSVLSITEPTGTNCDWHRAVPDLLLHRSLLQPPLQLPKPCQLCPIQGR